MQKYHRKCEISLQRDNSRLKNKLVVVIGISSGIAAYKIFDLVLLLKEKGIDVFVIMTKNAAQFISPSLFEKASGHKVRVNLFSSRFNYLEILKNKQVEHIKIASKADLIVVAPATANIIGKIAVGIADDFLTTTLLATLSPILICPSMNSNMWRNQIVQENIKRLQSLGYNILFPEQGPLACGEIGVGRLARVTKIADKIFCLINNKGKLKDKKIMVTAGGTVESIDPVRVITNRSSGKMGVAIAEACFAQGAEITLLRGKSSIVPISPIKEKLFETANELEILIRKSIKYYDVIIHNAAVSDYVPQKSIKRKIDSRKSLTLHLRPTLKILHQLKIWNPNIKVIGFKAVYKEEEENLIKIGIEKLKESHSDYIIVNDIGKEGIGFGADDNEVYIISTKGLEVKIPMSSKKEVARKILEYIFPDLIPIDCN